MKTSIVCTLIPLTGLVLVSCSAPDGRTVREALERARAVVKPRPSYSLDVYLETRGQKQIWLAVERVDGPARNEDVTLAFDEPASLGVVIRDGERWYSDLGEVEIDGKAVEVRPVDELEGLVAIWWVKVEAGEASYRNSDRNPGWWDTIGYVESTVAAGRQSVREVDVSPVERRGVVWDGTAVGTMRYRVLAEFGDWMLATPGAEAAGKGGTLVGVRRVTRLGGTGEPVVDHALGLANLPYIWGSAHVMGESVSDSHQSESFIGADCADLVVAAWRMAGLDADYSAVVPMIGKFGPSELGTMITSKNGAVFYEKSERIAVVPGAMVAWRFGKGGRKGHAAVLVEDLGPDGEPNGYLDEHDLVLHTMWEPPVLEPISEVFESRDPVAVINPVPAPDKRVEVNLTTQMLRAYEDDTLVYEFKISSGRKTPQGTYRIWKKHRMKDMKVGMVVKNDFYVIEDVPYIMFYEGEDMPRERGFAIHGAYWHEEFGRPISHGCINMRVEEARMLFDWTGPALGGETHVLESEGNPGTPVRVYGSAAGG